MSRVKYCSGRQLPLASSLLRSDDISYVIGGYNWKARFVGKDGYIITGPEGADPFGAQYNFANPIVGNDPHWVPYH